jgi:hypothetical protein
MRPWRSSRLGHERDLLVSGGGPAPSRAFCLWKGNIYCMQQPRMHFRKPQNAEEERWRAPSSGSSGSSGGNAAGLPWDMLEFLFLYSNELGRALNA